MKHIHFKEITLSEEVTSPFIVKNVTLIAPGTWKDSITKAPVLYRKETLKKFANNWKSYRLSLNHKSKVEDTVGYISNIKWNEEKEAITGDLNTFPATTKARDIINEILLSKKLDSYPRIGISVNLLTDDIWNHEWNMREVKYLEFWGADLGNNPACKKCYI